MKPASGRPRVLVYSHDTYGLGHLRRSWLVASRLAELPVRPHVLLATGSPRAQAFTPPDGVDTLKLPAVTKARDGGYRSRTIDLPIEVLARLRGRIVLAAAEGFQPDVIVVDHAPLGMLGELAPLVEWASRRGGPRLVLGMRDIVDEPSRVVDEWSRDGVWAALERYDRILVYGDPSIRTTALDLSLEAAFPQKVRHVGYVGRPGLGGAVRTREPTIVVTGGGGGDAQDLLGAYADFLETVAGRARFRSVVLSGPFLSERRRRGLRDRLLATGHTVDVVDFTDEAEREISSAWGVVAMAGYNTVVELLASGTPAMLVPRSRPRREQALRAERLRGVAGFDVCAADDLGPERFAAFVDSVLGGVTGSPAPLRLDGLDNLAREVAALLVECGEPTTVAGTVVTTTAVSSAVR